MQDAFWVQDPAPVLLMAGQPSAAIRRGCARVSAKGPCRDAVSVLAISSVWVVLCLGIFA